MCFRAECVSQGVLQMIREAPNGSIWVSEGEKPSYQVITPSQQSLSSNSRKGMSTDKKDKGKRSLSLTSQ